MFITPVRVLKIAFNDSILSVSWINVLHFFIAFSQLKISFYGAHQLNFYFVYRHRENVKIFLCACIRPMTPSNNSDSESEMSSAYGSLEEWNSHQILVIFKTHAWEMHEKQGRGNDSIGVCDLMMVLLECVEEKSLEK